jgi:hypothetical protein
VRRPATTRFDTALADFEEVVRIALSRPRASGEEVGE